MPVFRHAVGGLTVHLVEAGMENYVYVVAWDGGGLVVDPAETEPVRAVLTEHGIQPAAILATHAHGDHVAGIPGLKQAYGCEVIGPGGAGIPGLDRPVGEGDEVSVGPLRFRVLETPGHTAADRSFLCADAGILFCGDTLFSGGCGRLFECEADVMWQSLQRLRALPGHTEIYCGHEYTESNLRFAVSILPDDDALGHRLRQVQARRATGRPTLPTTIGEETHTNLFLRADEPAVQAAVGLEGAGGEQVFAELRKRKDRF